MSNPLSQLAKRKVPQFPDIKKKNKSKSINEKKASFISDEEDVYAYLANHPKTLDDYVMKYVKMADVTTWYRMKMLKENNDFDQDILDSEELLHKKKISVYDEHISTCDMSDNMKQSIQNDQLLPLIYGLAKTIIPSIKADGMSLYAIIGNRLAVYTPSVVTVERNDNTNYSLTKISHIKLKNTVATHCAFEKEIVVVSNLEFDNRFPRGIGTYDTLSVNAVMCIPIIMANDDVIGVLEFTRMRNKPVFLNSDVQRAVRSISWVCLATEQIKQNRGLEKQLELSNYLLNMSRAHATEESRISTLIEKIMQFTKELVHADRCSLFLVDNEKKELYMDIFDDGTMDETGNFVFRRDQDIRVKFTSGIAGYVARTGNSVNIPDAYKDPRFNDAIDLKTGYVTHSILCIPVITHGQVIGVVQMINKLNDLGVFNETDEETFKMFAVYCAQSLRYAQLYNDLTIKTAHSDIALEQLIFHATCTEAEALDLYEKWSIIPVHILEELDSFNYIGVEEYNQFLPHIYIHMFVNLCGEDSVDLMKLCRFVLTVKRNYRPMPYHNWSHGWDVAHAVYCIFKRMINERKDKGIFTKFTMRSVFIAALTHDVDHRGHNNSWVAEQKEPLSVIYKSSILEQHHFNMLQRILELDSHNIFVGLDPVLAEKNTRVMKHCIISTDLVTFFPNERKLRELYEKDDFDFEDVQHRDMLLAMIMTAADLSGNTKSILQQRKIVESLVEEFYIQGDQEKLLGRTPIPLMNRDNKGNLAKDEINFLKYICSPCYRTLGRICPELNLLYESTLKNQAYWEEVWAAKLAADEEAEKRRLAMQLAIANSFEEFKHSATIISAKNAASEQDVKNKTTKSDVRVQKRTSDFQGSNK